MNDSGEVYPPEKKVKVFLDGIGYFMLLGHTGGIETEYKETMRYKREVPASSCPSYVGNIFYATGESEDKDEQSCFDSIMLKHDEKAEKYIRPKIRKEKKESRFHKLRRMGVRGGEWCSVDTDNNFVHHGVTYHISNSVDGYAPKETSNGILYDMDRILVSGGQYYDMNCDPIDMAMISACSN